MSNYLIPICEAWPARAEEIANWAMKPLVNRTDIWGRYLAPKRRGDDGENKAIAAIFARERGRVSSEKNLWLSISKPNMAA